MSQNTETQALLTSIINGDERAVQQLVDMYRTRVYNTILGLVQNKQDAEELAQDVFVEVISAATRFRGESSLGTWIYRIAVNTSLDHLKKKKRKKRFAFLSSLWDDAMQPVIQPADFVHPGVVLEKQEESIFFFKALEQLPESQKTAIILVSLEGLSYEEAGQVMKTTVSSLESLLVRGKQNLKKYLAQYYDDHIAGKK